MIAVIKGRHLFKNISLRRGAYSRKRLSIFKEGTCLKTFLYVGALIQGRGLVYSRKALV